MFARLLSRRICCVLIRILFFKRDRIMSITADLHLAIFPALHNQNRAFFSSNFAEFVFDLPTKMFEHGRALP
jgi:hypothetical protein